MVTRTSLTSLVLPRAGLWLVRLALATSAVVAIVWGAFCLPVFFDQMRLEATQNLIIQNVPIGQEAVTSLMPLLDRAAARPDCIPAIDRSSAIIRLRIAESAPSSESHDQADGRMKALDHALRKSLGCAPADSYLWLVLFWTRNTRDGFTPANLDLLRMSYRLGPNEGWIVPKRSYLSLTLFDVLPPDLAAETRAEFARLVKSELYSEAMAILSGPGWPYRDMLMASLSSVPERNVAILVKAMADIGYEVRQNAGARPRG
ncbi:hypothetical protein FIU28_16935 [Tardiphaga sp. vice154]|nr:hypothetical protein FIU28_16935 [Tardiphaga sp. vice154]